MMALIDYGSGNLRRAQKALLKGGDFDAACGQLRLKTERELSATA